MPGASAVRAPFHEAEHVVRCDRSAWFSPVLWLRCNESIFSLKCFAFQTIRPVVSRKKHGFSAHFGPGGAVPPPRVLPFSKLKRSIRNQRMNRPTDDTQRAFLREGYAHLRRMPPGNAFHAACSWPVRLFLKIVVVYFAGERKGGTRRFSEQTLCVFIRSVVCGKSAVFRSLRAGRRCAAASRFPLFQSGNALEQFNFEKAGRSVPM